MAVLIDENDFRTHIHTVPSDVVFDVVENENNSKFLRANAIDKTRPHVLTDGQNEVKIVYNVAAGAWGVAATFLADIVKEEDFQAYQPAPEAASEPPAEVPEAAKEDPLDVLYPVKDQ